MFFYKLMCLKKNYSMVPVCNLVDLTNKFTAYLNKTCCIDVSAQTYKANCPPVALTKLPLISSHQTVDFVISKMNEALGKIRKQ